MSSSDTIKILAHTFKEKPEIITYSNMMSGPISPNMGNNKSDDIILDNLNLDSKTPPKDKIQPTPSVIYAEEPPKTIKETNQNITIDIDTKTI
jgi:hypothetical protein